MITELSEHQSKVLIPESAMLDASIPIVLVDKVTAFVVIPKAINREETYFALFICSQMY